MAVSLALAACFLFSGLAAAADSGLARIKENDRLVAAMPGRDVYPYVYHDALGGLVGMDVDLAGDIAARLGVKLKIDTGAASGQEAIDRVFRGEADLALGGLKILLAPAQRVSFTRAYLTLNYALLVNRVGLSALELDGPALGSLKTCCARIGALDQAPDPEKAARAFPRARIMVSKDLSRLLEDVSRGRLLGLFCDEIQARTILLKDPSLGLDMVPVAAPESRESLGLALAWPDRHLKAWLDLYLKMAGPRESPDLILKRYPLVSRVKP